MDEQTPRKPPPARPPTGTPDDPTPATSRKGGRGPEAARRLDSGRGGRQDKRRAARKPTPARELTKADGPPPEKEDPDLAEVRLVTGERSWTVRVLGRSGAGPGGGVPLLLLGFWLPDRPDGEHALEATVVARSLAALSVASLEEALDAAEPPPDPDRKRSFFDAAGQGRGR